MDENKISVRYAKALFSFAVERKLLDEVKKDIDLIEKTIGTVPEFKIVLTNPVFKTSDKVRLFKVIFAEKINSVTLSFLNLVLANKRESFLESILRNFLALYRRNAGFKSAAISSAVELDPDSVENLKQLIKNMFKTDIELTCIVNPDLIGGFILRVEDQQLDASVLSKLKGLKLELLK